VISISLLGTGDYQTAKYRYNDMLCETKYFPYAVKTIFSPSSIIVLMTEEARKVHGDELTKLCKYDEVIIPEGKTEIELWEIFDDIITINLPEKSEVILDITHGFRSQPLIAAASVIYLRTFKGINFSKILYGAFEARDKTSQETPVFDLKTFIDLFDWSYAAYEFIENGNARELRKILVEIQRQRFLQYKKTEFDKIKSFGLTLDTLTKALSLVNIKEAFQKASELSEKAEVIISELNNYPESKPFALLFSKIVDKIEPISHAHMDLFNNYGIKAQIEIIKWFLDTVQYQQAVTLMCELFITHKCLEEKLEPLERENREKISKTLGGFIQKQKNKEMLTNEDKEYLSIWNDLSKTRNEINHAGMNKEFVKSSSHLTRIKDLFPKLKELIGL